MSVHVNVQVGEIEPIKADTVGALWYKPSTNIWYSCTSLTPLTWTAGAGTTFDSLSTIGVIGTGSNQVAAGNHVHTPGVGSGYTINVQALTSSPADGATVYFGQQPRAPGAVNLSRVYIRKAGTIKIANILCQSGTAGTAEAWSLYIRLNNTTDYLISTLTLATAERVFTNSELNIAVVAGNYFEIKSVQPTWATNPLTTIYGGYIYIE